MKYHPEQIGDNKVRYALIQEGNRTLFVIGLNPSTANAEKPDPTMRCVMAFAEKNGFDGYIMCNLYPLRATFPKDLPKEYDVNLHQTNLQFIEGLLMGRNNIHVWLAYGANTKNRKYFTACINDIISLFKKYNATFYHANDLTKDGYPKHPTRNPISSLIAYNP